MKPCPSPSLAEPGGDEGEGLAASQACATARGLQPPSPPTTPISLQASLLGPSATSLLQPILTVLVRLPPTTTSRPA